MGEARVTQAGVYQELDGDSIRITQAGVYAEYDPYELRTTQAGVYVELKVKPDKPYATVVYNNTDISEWVNSASLEAAISNINANDFASTDSESIAGIPKWRIALTGLYDSEIDGHMLPEVITADGSQKTAAIQLHDQYGVTVQYLWASAANIKQVSVDAKLFDATKWQMELVLSNAPERTVD